MKRTVFDCDRCGGHIGAPRGPNGLVQFLVTVPHVRVVAEDETTAKAELDLCTVCAAVLLESLVHIHIPLPQRQEWLKQVRKKG